MFLDTIFSLCCALFLKINVNKLTYSVYSRERLGYIGRRTLSLGQLYNDCFILKAKGVRERERGKDNSVADAFPLCGLGETRDR